MVDFATIFSLVDRQTVAMGKSWGQMTVHWPQSMQELIILLAVRVPWTMAWLL